MLTQSDRWFLTLNTMCVIAALAPTGSPIAWVSIAVAAVALVFTALTK